MKKLEEQTEEQQLDFYQKLFDSLGCFVYSFNVDPFKPVWKNKESGEQDINQKVLEQEQLEYSQGLQTEINNCIQFLNEHAEGEEAYHSIHNAYYNDGKWRWRYATVQAMNRDSDKKVTQIIGFVIDITDQVSEDETLKKALRDAVMPGFNNLTNAEKRILEFMVSGFTTKEIAQHLYRSVKTVENHRLSIFKKLNVKNIAELTSLVFAKREE